MNELPFPGNLAELRGMIQLPNHAGIKNIFLLMRLRATRLVGTWEECDGFSCHNCQL